MIQLQDNLNITKSSRKITDEGYLKATAALTRVGTQDYRESDVTGNPKDTNIVKVFRSADTVFNDGTIESAKLKPITMHHPSTMVDSENHHNLSVGTIGENISQLDENRLGASIIITNKAIIDDIMAGKVSQVSVGYSANIKKESGIFNGDYYDYIFDGPMNINHCAIVPKGRCGETVSILDKNEDQIMTKDELKEIMLNDADFKEVLKELLDVMQQEKAEKHQEVNDEKNINDTEETAEEPMEDNLETVVEEGISESNPVDHQPSEEVKLKDQEVETAVKVRVNVIGKASKLLDEDLTELSNREILEKIFTDHKDKSEDYLMGMLDAAVDNHEKAKQGLKNISDSFASKTSYNKHYSAIEIQKL